MDSISCIISLVTCLLSFICLVVAEFVPAPLTFNGTEKYSGPNGVFKSHAGFSTIRYSPGFRKRYVVTVPEGQLAVLTIPTTFSAAFNIRPYDFAVIYDGASASRITTPCDYWSYVALGKEGINFLPVRNIDKDTFRVFTSETNVVACDFCVHTYDSGSADLTRLGFLAIWSASSPVTANPTTTRNSTPKPSTAVITIGTSALTTSLRTTKSPETCSKLLVPPSNTPNVRIVGGVQAAPGSWPSICTFIRSDGFQFCGCTVIDRQWVLTAAHCCIWRESVFKQQVQVYWGESDLRNCSAQSGTILGISRVISHPQFLSTDGGENWDFDIALVKLSTPISASNTKFAPACLPSLPVSSMPFVQVGTKGRRVCYVAGWGSTLARQNSGDQKLLQQTSIEMFSQHDCRAAFADNSFKDNMICGGYDNGGYDSCQGDSGGPLMCDQGDGSWALFGAVSWGEGCARPGRPGVYINVYNFKSWISQTMIAN